MKFVDEVVIVVQAGNGGAGCLSFLREKCMPLGGPDGGDGGDGGAVFLQADEGFNTLAKFRFQRRFSAKNGQPGMGKDRRGVSAGDLVVLVPVGTLVFDEDTSELIDDLTAAGQRVCVAKGGFHGLGNARFKSSVNRAPRKTTLGSKGESRNLRLELKVLADVGLLGLPNAGKSSFIRAVSNARPKVADYPFTTLVPNLGVVPVGDYQSFVVADIPGLISGAHRGVGLGIRFLRHLSRTRLLLHFIDFADELQDPVDSFQNIQQELNQFSTELAKKPQWLVLNKIDMMLPEVAEQRKEELLRRLGWDGPVFMVSALSKQGTADLCQKIAALVM